MELFLWDLSSTGVVATAEVDSEGAYELVHVENGPCVESLFELRASAPARAPQSREWPNADSIYVRCTEDTQQIDFALQPE